MKERDQDRYEIYISELDLTASVYDQKQFDPPIHGVYSRT